jgi:serine acetyltransferase/glycosyltransferase involved in cell wall biosynthesis
VSSVLPLSVVIATYNRGALLVRLLEQLAEQTLASDAFEVIVVDDGSKEPADAHVHGRAWPFALRVLRQPNRGAAAARHNGATVASGEVILFIDDDMFAPPALLAEHLRVHDRDPKAVVLGRIRQDASMKVTLFDRFHLRVLDRLTDAVRSGRQTLRGVDVWTGNVSMRRAHYVAVGGFDLSLERSEDAELGVRLEKHGATFHLSEEAFSVHSSDHTSLQGWMNRAYRYGIFDSRIGKKHADVPGASPWRYFSIVNPVSRPFLAASIVAPRAAAAVARGAMQVALGMDALGLERVAIAGCTLVFGMEYARGMRDEAGSVLDAAGAYLEFAERRGAKGAGEKASIALRHLVEGIRADHATLWRYRAKYREEPAADTSVSRDAVEKIGFQMMGAYRLMRFFKEAGVPLAPQVISRTIRHLYGSDIHWDAELAPGVVLVHGMGLAISDEAKVKKGVILFQHVTLGTSSGPNGSAGAPTIEEDVHIGAGATIVGPITIGARSKIMAGCFVRESVPADSLVSAPDPVVSTRVRPRTPGAPSAERSNVSRARRGSG